jgi:hypothetical protein
MGSPSRRELEEENRTLRKTLEEIYDQVADQLGVDENDDEDPE